MSTYAVINPANGETIKEYPEIGDDELRAAIGRADEASRTYPASTSVAERGELGKIVIGYCTKIGGYVIGFLRTRLAVIVKVAFAAQHGKVFGNNFGCVLLCAFFVFK